MTKHGNFLSSLGNLLLPLWLITFLEHAQPRSSPPMDLGVQRREGDVKNHTYLKSKGLPHAPSHAC